MSKKELLKQIKTIEKHISCFNPDGIILFEMSRRYRELKVMYKAK